MENVLSCLNNFKFYKNLFMLTQVFASAVFGSDAVPITIELHIGEGDEDINQSVL